MKERRILTNSTTERRIHHETVAIALGAERLGKSLGPMSINSLRFWSNSLKNSILESGWCNSLASQLVGTRVFLEHQEVVKERSRKTKTEANKAWLSQAVIIVSHWSVVSQQTVVKKTASEGPILDAA